MKSHTGLVGTQDHTANKAVKDLIEKGSHLDVLHDDWAKALYNFLSALILIIINVKLVERIKHLRRVLFPEGLTIVNKSYHAEAGAVKMRESGLNDSDKDLLENIFTPEGPLLHVLNRWNQIALELEEVENLKIEVAKGPKPTARDILNARHKWVKTTKAFLFMADMAEELPDPIKKWVERVNSVERAAFQRKKSPNICTRSDSSYTYNDRSSRK